MADDTPFEGKVRRAADSALLTLVARWAMVVTLPLGGFVGAGVWAKLDETSVRAVRLEEKITSLIDRQIPDLNTRIEGRFNEQSNRLVDQAHRIGKLEDWRNMRGGP